MEKGVALHLDNLEAPSPKDAMMLHVSRTPRIIADRVIKIWPPKACWPWQCVKILSSTFK